jgi:hypothetical protein
MYKRSHVAVLVFLAAGLVHNVFADGDPSNRTTPAARIVAIGDLHGDIEAARGALKLAGAIDDEDRWIGGDLVVVQTGDQIDRGDNDREVLDLLTRLADEATRAGGALYALNGNHELMNGALDLRYVTPAGFIEFADYDTVDDLADTVLAGLPVEQRGRAVAFRPGGPYAVVLASRNVIMIVGDNLFVHGGVRPEHVEYGIARINEEVQAWLRGDAESPEGIHTSTSPTWDRSYSDEVGADDCEVLQDVLDKLGVKRMVVGHSVQKEGITSYCDNRVWCIDVGMSAHYGGTIQVLEIVGDSLRVLNPN